MQNNLASQAIAGDSSHSEFVWAIVIVILGIVPRLIFITLFPTKPFSDFKAIVDFAVALRDSGFARDVRYWEFLNPGLSTSLSVILRVFPGSPDTIARWATAILMGVVPLIPYVILRGVLSLRARVIAGLLLALWPGQIFFSGVVAQDNWVLIPTIALSALAVRSLMAQDGGHPFWSAVLLVLGTFIRQEMLIALLPVAFVSAGLGAGSKHLMKNLFLWTVAALLLLLVIAGQRAAATGRFALTTEHGGTSVLGAYIPGAGLDFWTDPTPYIASIDPSLLEDNKRLQEESFLLALNEAFRRPKFHVIRMAVATLSCLSHSDTSNLYWSLGNPNVLPSEYHEQAAVFIKKASPLLNSGLFILHTVFLASLFLGIARRNWSIIVVTSAILLKIIIHAVLVAQPRYFVPVIALEIIVIAMGIDEVIKHKQAVKFVFVMAGAAAMIFLVKGANTKAMTYVLTYEHDIQRVYRFSLNEPKGHSLLKCVVDRGRLSALTQQSALIELFHTDPSPGETAIAKCRLIGAGNPIPLTFQVMDPYAPGGLPDRIVQRVVVDGKELLYHDIAAESGSSWSNVPLGLVGRDTDRSVVIEIIAIRPDPGCAWGAAAKTNFQLAVSGTN